MTSHQEIVLTHSQVLILPSFQIAQSQKLATCPSYMPHPLRLLPRPPALALAGVCHPRHHPGSRMFGFGVLDSAHRPLPHLKWPVSTSVKSNSVSSSYRSFPCTLLYVDDHCWGRIHILQKYTLAFLCQLLNKGG